MKFQNISVHGSKVMLCTKTRDKRMNEQTNERTKKPEAICPPTFFKVGGIKKQDGGCVGHFGFPFNIILPTFISTGQPVVPL